MKRYATLPLGLDLGSTRVRIALAESNGDDVRIVSVTSRKRPDRSEESDGCMLDAALLEEMLGELGSRERRCIVSMRAPDAVLRAVQFPRMSALERQRAARFEAGRFAGWDIEAEDSDIRIHPVMGAPGSYAVGVVRRSALLARLAPARSARLRIVAVDHEALALRRSFAQHEAIIDVGLERTSVHAFGGETPVSWSAAVGGAEITRGIARDLSIDVAAAEKRKCIVGSAGAGAAACRDIAAHIGNIVQRARSRLSVTRIAVTGNGARLPGLMSQLESFVGSAIEMPVPDYLRSGVYPEDVVRAAAPDWSLAAGLALWGSRT